MIGHFLFISKVSFFPRYHWIQNPGNYQLTSLFILFLGELFRIHNKNLLCDDILNKVDLILIILFLRYVRWRRTYPQIIALFPHGLPSMFGSHRRHLCPRYGTISMSDLPWTDHHPTGWGLRPTPIFSCQPTFRFDGKTTSRSHSQMFHPSNSGEIFRQRGAGIKRSPHSFVK